MQFKIEGGLNYFMEESEDYSKNVVFKEYALPNIILICICTLVYLGFAFGPIMLIVDSTRDLQSSIVFYIILGIFSLILLTSYIVVLCYLILIIKYKNIFCSEDEIYIRYRDRWIVKVKYSEITEYGDVYFYGQYINAKKSLHCKRGEQLNKQYSFYLNKEDRVYLCNLLKSKAENMEKIL